MAKSGGIRLAGNQPALAENRVARDAGTVPATTITLQSCDLALPDKLPVRGDVAAGNAHARAQERSWGGARNRADRVSEHLTRRQVEGMLQAAARLEKQSKKFNRHWTVHYERAGIADRDGAAFVRGILKRAGEMVRRAGGSMAAIWVRENGNGKGAHVHILLHVPNGFTLRNRTRRWIEAAGGTYRRNVSRVTIIGGTLASARADSQRHRANVQAILGYLCKAANPATGKALGLPRYGEGGRVIGKRCGWTQNIGRGSA